MTVALVDDVRRMAGASETDATDADIARELERARMLVTREMCWQPELVEGGTLQYSVGRVKPWGQFAPGTAGQTNSGTIPVGVMRDGLGVVVTDWTLDRDGWVTFGTPQAIGSALYLRAYGYDVYAAAASVLEDMAAVQLRQYDVKLGGDEQTRSQKAANLSAQARLYRKKQLAKTVEAVRSDEQW